MNLFRPLELAKASTERLEFVPTKKFFKPVLVITAPVTLEEGELLRCEYLWNDKGLPRDFDGSHKLTGELPGAKLSLCGESRSEVIDTEKVAHFTLFRQDGMRLRLRAHLPENEQLLELLSFLSELNKDGFKLVVRDAQVSLLGENAGGDSSGERQSPPERYPEPDLNGFFDPKDAVARPFSNKKLKCTIYTLETKDGFLFGWSLNASAMKDAKTGGRDLNTSHATLPSESQAREHAVAEALAFITDENFHIEGKAEEKAVSDLKDYLFDIAPNLARGFGEASNG